MNGMHLAIHQEEKRKTEVIRRHYTSLYNGWHILRFGTARSANVSYIDAESYCIRHAYEIIFDNGYRRYSIQD